MFGGDFYLFYCKMCFVTQWKPICHKHVSAGNWFGNLSFVFGYFMDVFSWIIVGSFWWSLLQMVFWIFFYLLSVLIIIIIIVCIVQVRSMQSHLEIIFSKWPAAWKVFITIKLTLKRWKWEKKLLHETRESKKNELFTNWNWNDCHTDSSCFVPFWNEIHVKGGQCVERKYCALRCEQKAARWYEPRKTMKQNLHIQTSKYVLSLVLFIIGH